jgi:hypothetical protein
MGWLNESTRARKPAPIPDDAAQAIRVLESRLEKLTKESLEPIDPPFLKPSDYYDDWYPERRAFPRGYPQDKKYGENWPIIRHEEDLRLARGTSRLLSETNPLCIGFLNHVTNFVVGSGFKWHVGLKGQKGDKDDKDPAVIQAQRFLDDFRALNGWGDTGEVSIGDGTDDDDSPSTDLEAEAYSSAMSDGEFFLRLFPGDGSTNGVPMVRRVNPECVYCPPGEMQQGPWSFGIETDPDDRQRRLNYHVADPDDYPANGEIVRAGEIVHLKLNSVSDVKRGVPDFWPLEHEARHIRKLWQNMSEVSAILSAIAYIRQHAAGVTGTQISRIVDATATGRDFRVPLSEDRAGGDNYRSYTRMDGGTVIDVTNGQEWVPPPIAAGIPGFTQAMQATLRIFGLRWGCPEYFSGDASNANFASTLVAGGPFERATQRRQRQFRIFQGNLASRVLLFGVKAGRLRREDVQRLSIAIDPPAVAIANKAEDTQRRATLNQAGVLSVRTWAAEEGLDPEAEAAQIKAEKAAAKPQPGMGGGEPGAPVPGGEPQPDAGGMDLATLLGESVITEATPDGHLADGEAFFFEDRSGLVKKVITNRAGRKQTVYVRPKDDTARADADKSVQAVLDSTTVVATAIGQVDRLTMSQMHRLADHVSNLNRDEIRAHLKTLGERIGGAKVALAQRLVERIRAEHGKTEPFVQPRPETEPATATGGGGAEGPPVEPPAPPAAPEPEQPKGPVLSKEDEKTLDKLDFYPDKTNPGRWSKYVDGRWVQYHETSIRQWLDTQADPAKPKGLPAEGLEPVRAKPTASPEMKRLASQLSQFSPTDSSGRPLDLEAAAAEPEILASWFNGSKDLGGGPSLAVKKAARPILKQMGLGSSLRGLHPEEQKDVQAIIAGLGEMGRGFRFDGNTVYYGTRGGGNVSVSYVTDPTPEGVVAAMRIASADQERKAIETARRIAGERSANNS